MNAEKALASSRSFFSRFSVFMHSPLSRQAPQKLRDLPRDYLLKELKEYFGAEPPAEIVENNYTLWRCAETSLEFCDPLRPGNTAFYEWIASFARYYPGRRWEYEEVARILREELTTGPGAKVLDVGCGEGDFLRQLTDFPVDKKYALDLNEPSVEACRAQGFQAFCGTLEGALQGGWLQAGEFSAVTAFHCLEHVNDPIGFVQGLLRLIAPGGRVFLSTPYSPMSFETSWFDVLNHPPHHMTRWNLAAYRRLAELVGAKMRHFAPKSSAFRQACHIFCLKKYGLDLPPQRKTLMLDALLHAPQIVYLWWKMWRRAWHHENGGSNVILVELTPP